MNSIGHGWKRCYLMSKEAKSDDAEMIRRVDLVFELTVKGLRRGQILQYVAKETKWDVTDRTVDDYIAAARKEFTKRSKYVRSQEFSKAKARLELLFQMNMQIQDYKAALATQKDINDLLGLYEPERHEFTGKGGAPLQAPVVYLPTVASLDDLETD